MNKIKVSGNLWRYSVSAFYFNRVFLLVMLIVLSFLVRQMTFLVHFYLAVKLSQPKVLNLACVLQLNRIYSAFAWLGPPVQYMISYLCSALQRYLLSFPSFLSLLFSTISCSLNKAIWSSNLQYKKSFYCVVEWIPENVVYWVLRRDSGDFLRIHRPVQAKMHWGQAPFPKP